MPSKKHIAHIMGTTNAGGTQRSLLGWMNNPDFAAYRHSLICSFPDQSEMREEFAKCVDEIYYVPFPWPQQTVTPSYRLSKWIRHRLEFTYPTRLGNLLGEINADLVHSHLTYRTNLQAQAALCKARLPWVWTVYGYFTEYPAMAEAVELARRHRGRVTTVSQSLIDDLLNRQIGSSVDYQMIHLGADVNRFLNTPRNNIWRSRLAIPADEVIFGTSARLSIEKGLDVLVDAARHLENMGQAFHCLVAGSGPEEPALKQQITTHGLGNRIHLIGYQENMAEFLAGIDVFVLPSRSEGFPVALIEALAAGLPCVTADVGGVRELTGDQGALLVKPEAPAALAEAMRQMLEATIRRQYALNAPALARQHSFESCAAKYVEIYEELLATVN